MSARVTKTLAVGLMMSLAACGGADSDIFSIADAPTGPISAAEAQQLSSAYTRQSTRVFGLPLTEDLGVPNVGQATFEGSAALVITPTGASQPFTFIGDSALRADFGEAVLHAQMDSFSGRAMNGLDMRLDGEILMENGRIGFGGASNISGVYRGDLRGRGVAIDTGGMLFGNFRNTPVAAVSLSGNDATAIYNDNAASATLTVVAE